MTPLRICLSSGGIGGGGIGMVMIHLAEAMIARGHAVDLLHLDERTERRPPPGCTAICIGRRTRHAMPATVAYLRRARPDLILSARDYINLLMLGARALAFPVGPRPRLIWTFHTHRASERAHMTRRSDRLADWLMCRAVSRPDALVAVSDTVADGLADDLGMPRERLTVIENPVWTAPRLARRETPCAHPWLRHRPPLTRVRPDDPLPVIVSVGRMVPQKDFPTLIRAVARLDVPARLILLGDGPERSRLAQQVAAAGLAGRIDLAGHVADVLPYLSRADLFVSASRWEGFPLALVEALGSGCPVVATDCPGGAADILQGGHLGRLVPPGDDRALASAIAAALAEPGDPAPRMAAAHRFDADRAAERYLALAPRRPALPAQGPAGAAPR